MRTLSNNLIGQALDQFMHQSLSDVLGVDAFSARPSVNVREEKDKHILELAIPGIPKENIDVNIEKDKLIISAQKTVEAAESSEENQKGEQQAIVNNDHYVSREFDFQNFKRSFHLPDTADKNKVSAQYDAGILTISIGKKEEAVDHGPISIMVN